VTALLELGSGFNPEYTGRDNILLSGQILGFSEEEMRRRMDVIIRFAELEGFVDQPVKTYSTGMLMRLAFASAIHVDPDVLIVDEALSVGDVYFQRKSLDRMEYFRKAGKTVLFVSHEPTLVQRFCARALWLEQGRVAMVGDAKEVVTSYQAFCARLEEERLRDRAVNGGIASREHDDILRELKLTGSRWGNGRIRFTGVEMINSRGEQAWIVKTGEETTIRFRLEADDDYPAPVFAIDMHRFDGVFVGSVNNVDTHPAPLPVKKGGNTLELRLPSLELPLNSYFLSLKAYTENDAPDWKNPADIHNQMYQFDVVTDRLIHGLMSFDAEWRGATMSEPKQRPVALP
jgi:ABC-type multidrug transport system ATPase subunit